jgi:cell surface protein SprA
MKAAGNTMLRLLISLKDGSVTYTDNRGTLLPGFMPEPTFLGNRISDMAPGMGFVFGDQTDIRKRAADNNWISTDTLLNAAYLTRVSKNLVIRANLEPLPFLKIDLTADRTEAINHQEYFKMGTDGEFASFAAQQGGNFSMSYLMWNTAFIGHRKDHSSPVFESFKENRLTIAQRLAEDNVLSQGVDTMGFPDGYSAVSQDVLLHSFLAAYSGSDPAGLKLNPFPSIPLPNWRITYNGLTQLPFFARYFRTFTVSHGYRSVYNVGSYMTNLEFREGLGMRDNAGNFISEMRIDVVTITEQFSPLFNIDMTWHNSLLSRFEVKHTRNLSLSFVNNQLTEVTSKEYLVGLGYRVQDLRFLVTSIGGTGRSQRVSSELNLKVDVSVRNNKTVLRRIDEDIDQVSSGQQLVAINFSADYMVSQNLTARAFFERSSTNPFISNQYPSSTTFSGISLRFTLAQ